MYDRQNYGLNKRKDNSTKGTIDINGYHKNPSYDDMVNIFTGGNSNLNQLYYPDWSKKQQIANEIKEAQQPVQEPTAPTRPQWNGGYSANVPRFNAPYVDRNYYANLAQKILDSQLAGINNAKKYQESQAYDAQNTARQDYFDQYRNAQYNRAGTGLGTSPIGNGQERRVQLAMSNTIGDILNAMNTNLAALDAQAEQAKAQRDINVENMYERAKQAAFNQALAQYNADLNATQMEMQQARDNSNNYYKQLQYENALQDQKEEDELYSQKKAEYDKQKAFENKLEGLYAIRKNFEEGSDEYKKYSDNINREINDFYDLGLYEPVPFPTISTPTIEEDKTKIKEFNPNRYWRPEDYAGADWYNSYSNFMKNR